MIPFKKKVLRIFRNFLGRRYRKAGEQYRKINRSFLRNVTSAVQAPIENAPAITSRRTDDTWKKLQPVWVLSTGRTGTQTLAALWNLSPLLQARHEPPPELFSFSFDYYRGTINRLQALQTLRYLRDEIVFRCFRDGFIYAESNNRLAYIAELLLELYPQSKFIFIYRNPYHFIRSGMRRGYYQNHLRDASRIVPNEESDYANSWNELAPIEKIAWNWAEVNAHCLSFINKLPADQSLSLSSEDLFAAESSFIESLFNFAGSSSYHPPATAVQRVMGKKHNAQQQGSYSKPSDWTNDQLSRVDSIIAPVARTLAYSLLSKKKSSKV